VGTQPRVSDMKSLRMFGGGMVLAALFSTVAQAQSVPPLAYVQPMPPPAVQAVQEHLRTAGAYSGPADGVWGPDSAAALQRFQAGHQLQVTGQLNQATAASLGLDPVTLLGAQQAALASPLPPPESLRPSSVRSIQSQLRHLGFYSGNVDGVWGDGTQTSVAQFQQNRGLQPNGQLTPATITAMGLVPDSIAYK
jgi:peptidoglycan hydrolase-like protein with peptidoglycan-binding domain